MGIVETSRGCGLGCDFCTLAHVPMAHFPPEFIQRDVETNVASGIRDVSLISEDLFRYGGAAARPNPDALIGLLRLLREDASLGMIQTDHANVMSVAGFSDAQLAEVHSLMCGPRPRPVWVNLGVETASARLLETLSARAKARPCEPAAWADTCREQVMRLARAGFMPMVSLVIGLDGETPEDVEITRRWVESLGDARVLVFPMILAPTDAEPSPAARARLRPEHGALFRTSYRLNFRWMPKLLWSEETAAGVSLCRRLAVEALAQGNVLLWKALLRLRA